MSSSLSHLALLSWGVCILLQGCGATMVIPGSGIDVPHRTVLVRRVPNYYENELAIYRSPEDNAVRLRPPPVVRLSDHDFALLRRTGVEAFQLERLGDSLNILWSTNLAMTRDEFLSGFFSHDGSLFVITTRFQGSDTVQAVERSYNATTGGMVSEKILDSKPGSFAWLKGDTARGYGMYKLKFSPDSTRILLYNYDCAAEQSSPRVIGMNAIITDATMNIQQTGRCDFVCNNGALDAYKTAAVSNGGNVFVIGYRTSDTLAVACHDLRSGSVTRMSYVHDGAEVDGSPSVLYSDIGVHVVSDNEVDIAFAPSDTLLYRMEGLDIVGFDTRRDSPTILVHNKFDQRANDELVDERFLRFYHIRDLQVTSEGNYLVSLEEFYSRMAEQFISRQGVTVSDGYYREWIMGPVLFFSYGRDGRINWQAARIKKQYTLSQGTFEDSFTSRIDEKGKLQLMYCGGRSDGLQWGTFDLGTGATLPERQLLNVGLKNYYVRAFTLWLTSDTVVVATVSETRGNPDLEFFKIRLPASQGASPR